MVAKNATLELYAVPFEEACRANGIRRDKGYALLRSGEWQSYRDGGLRMVLVASIQARRQRLLADTGGKFKPGPLRSQPRREASEQGEERA